MLKQFELHVDYAFKPVPPDSTLLFCIQPDPAYPDYGKSYLLSADDIVAALQEHDRTDLLDFALNAPMTLTFDKSPFESTDTTLIETRPAPEKGYYIRYRRRFMSDEFKRTYAKQLDEFEEFTQALAAEYVLSQGDFLVFANRRFVHGRGPCTLAYDENGRIISRQLTSVWGNQPESRQ